MAQDKSTYARPVEINQPGPVVFSVPRCAFGVLQVIATSSLAFSVQLFYTNTPPSTGSTGVNARTRGMDGRIYARGSTITPSAGEVLFIPCQGAYYIKLTVTAGTGSVYLRTTDLELHETGGGCQCYSFIPDATDELLIKASPAVVYGIQAFTIDATPVYVKLYDKASAPSEADTPVYRMGIPCNATAANGAGSNVTFPVPLLFSIGLGVRAVTGLADNSDSALTAAENFVNILYN